MSHNHKSPDLGLTEKNTAFARAVVLDVRRDKTMGDHYQDTFGGNMTRASYSCCASRLWRSPVIMEYVEKLREEMRERFMITVESLIEELQEIKLIALGAETPQCGAAVSAVLGKAKLAGLDKAVEEKIKIDGARTVTIVRAVRPSDDEDA
mgnify:CR=1 FL=1